MQKYLCIIMYCMKPLVTVSMETKRYMKNLTCDCMTHHGTQPVCKVSDLNYLPFLRFRVVNNNNNNKQKNWENELFVISIVSDAIFTIF